MHITIQAPYPRRSLFGRFFGFPSSQQSSTSPLFEKESSKNCVDDDTGDYFNEKEITVMAYHLMRAADEHLDDRVLEQREKTQEEFAKH